MPDFNFEMTLSADPKKLFELVTNYENYQEVFPDQLKNVSIVSRNDFEVITKEVLTFNTYFKNTELYQKTSHNVQYPKLSSNVIEGPFKGTVVKVTFDELDGGCKVTINVELKISLKYKILSPIIKNKYKNILTSLLYKMNNIAMND
tara:strand:- start:1536 stop:1976 length:441 start_codon:yes stop_codon:yes gene_type:complete